MGLNPGYLLTYCQQGVIPGNNIEKTVSWGL